MEVMPQSDIINFVWQNWPVWARRFCNVARKALANVASNDRALTDKLTALKRNHVELWASKVR
eukprot:11201969-Lingulodinium_polyedra.AAC.1